MPHAQVFKCTNNKKWRREKEQGSVFQEQGCDQATAPSDGLPPTKLRVEATYPLSWKMRKPGHHDVKRRSKT